MNARQRRKARRASREWIHILAERYEASTGMQVLSIALSPAMARRLGLPKAPGGSFSVVEVAEPLRLTAG